MSKVCQYATNDVKLCIGMKEASLKDTQQAMQKIITQITKFGKGWQEWDKACIEVNTLATRKLKTPMKTRFASRVVLFQETLQYANVINICYCK